jgi:DNA polymerase alpha subunit A
VNLEDPTPPEKQPSTLHTVVRALDKFPGGFEVRAKSEKSKILTMANERMLLANLLGWLRHSFIWSETPTDVISVTLQKYDPDVIVGHEFLGVTLDVLLHRLRELKVDHWSRIGRFRRTKWPVVGKQGTNIKFMNGRILCDMASDGAKVCLIW